MKTSHDLIWIKRLVWSYFFLLIFEGALRKWVVPSLANALLIVRDPVVIAIYGLAWRSGIFPRNVFVLVGGAIAFIALLAGLISPEITAFVALYGFRADFLHLPLIFIIAGVFSARDVQRVGYWVLCLSIPMALLMALQFRSPPEAWINAGSDENFKQISSALGHIRAAGTFSYILGPVYFYALATTFLLYNSFAQRYPQWLTLTGTIALIMAAAVSGSRALIVSCGLVFGIAFIASTIFKPILAFRWLGSLIGVGLIIYALQDVSIFQGAVDVFNARVSSASTTEGGGEGFLARILKDYTDPYPMLFDTPLLGRGLGMGTNAGAALLQGKAGFLLAENEWSRVILESGPLIGGAFIAYRIALAGWIGRIAMRHMLHYDPLPMLLFGVCVSGLINGGFGQPTVLGFTIFSSGLCLAATRVPQQVARAVVPSTSTTSIAAQEPVFS